jgi:hypothetical protein
MLKSYLPIYEIVVKLKSLQQTSSLYKDHTFGVRKVDDIDTEKFQVLLKDILRECLALGLTSTHEMAERLIERDSPGSYAAMFSDLYHLDGSLRTELKKEAVFRIPPERKGYFEHADLFGPEVGVAFSSCARDIQRAGNCYALGQEDACVHHLMLVLERGLNALAAKVGVPYQRTNWQVIIDQIGKHLGTKIPNAERDFYKQVNSQFGWLKDAYRNHSEHARDDHYDMPKALHILNHVRDFMQALEKGGLSE